MSLKELKIKAFDFSTYYGMITAIKHLLNKLPLYLYGFKSGFSLSIKYPKYVNHSHVIQLLSRFFFSKQSSNAQ